MADVVADEVLRLVATGEDLPRLAELLRGLDDKQRKALSGPVAKKAEEMWLDRDGGQAAAIAVVGCVTGLRQAAARLEWIPLDDRNAELAAEVAIARSPHWLPSLPEALLGGRERRADGFRLVRALVRTGVVARPEFPEYVLSMVHAVGEREGWKVRRTVLEGLRRDPGLLEHELWDLLTTEGAGRLLAAHDGWLLKPQPKQPGLPEALPARPQYSWQHAVTTLAADGDIDRARLLDMTVGAFLRDWPASDVGWFARLHDALAPGVDELAARQSTYGRLLAVEPGFVVTLGARALRELLQAGRLDADVLLANAPSALSRSDKGPVLETLKLLGDVAAGRPELVDAVADVAAGGLAHERVDVQERVLSLLAKLVPDDGRRAELAGRYADVMAPSLRAEAAPSARVESPNGPAGGALDHVREPAAGAGIVAVAAPLEPVADADELAELFARLVEEADDPAEVERLLEGVARLARQRPSRGADALVARLRKLGEEGSAYFPGPWTGQELRADLVALGLAWLDRRRPGPGPQGRDYDVQYRPKPDGSVEAGVLRRPDWTLTSLVTRRVHEVLVAVAGGGATLLSFPTRRDGTLAAEVLRARVDAVGRLTKPLPLDAGLAVLRVAPEEHEGLRRTLPAAHRVSKALQDQLDLLRGHRPDWERVVGPSQGYFRSDRLEAAVTWRDRVAPEGAVDKMVAAVLDRRDPLLNLALEAFDGEYASRFEQVVAMWPLLLPHHPDLLAAHAHARLNRALTKNRNGTEPLLDAIGAAATAVGPPSASALVLGLAAKNAGERAHAVDAIVDLAGRGLLSGSLLGAELGALLTADAVVGTRVVPGLADAARAGGAAVAGMVIDCVAVVLDVLPGRRDAHHFIDLLGQLAVQEGRSVRLPEPFAALARGKQGSVLAKACRRVPQ